MLTVAFTYIIECSLCSFLSLLNLCWTADIGSNQGLICIEESVGSL